MGMSRPLTRTQALQNRAFLKLLRKTGNVRLACRELGLKYGTMQDRRRKHPAFAVKWDAALVFAAARFEAVGVRGPAAGRPRCSPLRPVARKNPSTSYAGPPPLQMQERMNRAPPPPPRAGPPPPPAGGGLFWAQGGGPVPGRLAGRGARRCGRLRGRTPPPATLVPLPCKCRRG